MKYEQFALLYDELMNDVPYDKWVEFTEESLQQADMKEAKILDVACGTGNVTPAACAKGLRFNRCRSFRRNVNSRSAKLGGEGYFIPFINKTCESLMFQVSLIV